MHSRDKGMYVSVSAHLCAAGELQKYCVGMSLGSAVPEVVLIPSTKIPPFFRKCSNKLTDQ